MDILSHDFVRRILQEVAPFFDWVIAHWAITMVVLALAIFCASRNRSKRTP